MIEQRVLSKPKLRNPVLIEGLPGIGNVGKIAVDFIIESAGAEKFLQLRSTGYPASVYVNEEHLIEMPECALYVHHTKKRDLVFLAGDVQPVDEEHAFEFTHAVLRWCKENKVEMILAIGGIGLKAIPKDPKLHATTTDKKLLKELSKKGLQTKLHGFVGPIMGVTGLLAGLARDYQIPAACLLAETYNHPLYLGVKGARQVLSFLKAEYGIKVDLKELDSEIIAIEREIKKSKSLEPPTKKQVSYIG